jgi:hypothetical protein
MVGKKVKFFMENERRCGSVFFIENERRRGPSGERTGFLVI